MTVPNHTIPIDIQWRKNHHGTFDAIVITHFTAHIFFETYGNKTKYDAIGKAEKYAEQIFVTPDIRSYDNCIDGFTPEGMKVTI